MSERLIGWLMLLLACGATLACRRTPRPTLADCVERYQELVVQLGERDPDSLDFAYGLSSTVRAAQRHPQTLTQLHSEALQLEQELRSLQPGTPAEMQRRDQLLLQVDAVALRTRQVTGQAVGFDEESRRYFGVVVPPDQEAAARVRARAEIARLLGTPQNTAEALTKFEAGFVVPPARLPAVMQAALQACRAATVQHIALPADESVTVRYVSLQPWTGFSRYLGDDQSEIEINTDYPLTLDRVLDLACHEGYPGHHVFNLLRDRAVVQRQQREEFRVQPTFSPQSYVSEAAANNAVELAFAPAERLRVEQEVLAPLAGVKGDFPRYLAVEALLQPLQTAIPPLVREYLDGDMEFERAVQQLREQALMPQGEAVLLYVNEYRSYALTYTLGAEQFHAALQAGQASRAEQWARYRYVAEHTVTSIP